MGVTCKTVKHQAKLQMCLKHCIPKDARGGFTLACPCLPVLEVVMLTILQGRPLSMTWPFFLSEEHCMGYVTEAPDSPVWKSSSAMMGYGLCHVTQMSKKIQEQTI